jgi:hypothetical protein
MLHRKVIKYFVTNKESSARQVITYRSKNERDDHGNDSKSRSMRRCHHSPKKYIRRNHAILGLWRIPNVSLVMRKRRRPKEDILQGELGKIKTPNFNG